MKGKLIILSVSLWILFFTITSFCQGQDINHKFSIKLAGGYGKMTVGDLNTVIERQNSLFSDFAALLGLSKEGELKKLNWGIDLDGEFILNLTENFGIGIGAGYIRKSNDSIASFKGELLELSYSMEPELTTIPVYASIYFFYPVAHSLNVYINGGMGYYWGKFSHTYRMDVEIVGETAAWMESNAQGKDQGFGFHGGAGIEFNIGSSLAFFAEGKGRYCKLKSWGGDETWKDSDGWTDKTSGKWWYYEMLDPDLGKWVPIIEVSEDRPSGFDIKNERKFEADLSGISLRLGLRIKF